MGPFVLPPYHGELGAALGDVRGRLHPAPRQAAPTSPGRRVRAARGGQHADRRGLELRHLQRLLHDHRAGARDVWAQRAAAPRTAGCAPGRGDRDAHRRRRQPAGDLAAGRRRQRRARRARWGRSRSNRRHHLRSAPSGSHSVYATRLTLTRRACKRLLRPGSAAHRARPREPMRYQLSWHQLYWHQLSWHQLSWHQLSWHRLSWHQLSFCPR